MTRRGTVTVLAVLAMALAGVMAHAKNKAPAFFLHDGDTVVFYGDSITEQQMYGRDIEAYVATRFPRMHVKFLNSGWSGDTVRGGGGGPIETRLKRDVLPYKPTVVTIFLGMNDGGYTTDNPQNYRAYTTGLTHIVDELTQQLPGVRLTLLTPSFFDYAAKDRPPPPPGQGFSFGHPAPDYNQTLLHYGQFVTQLGAQRHIPVADLNAPMAAATALGRRTDPKFALSGDGVHPNEVGHLIMAAAVLKAWNAPSAVADIAVQPGKIVTAITPLPWPVPDSAKPAFTLSPLPASLDVFQANWGARFHGNAATPFALHDDGQLIATVPAAQLLSGVDLTQYPSLPENQQAQQVLALINDRIGKWHDFFKGNGGIAHANDVPTDAEIAALKAEDASLDALRAQESQAAQPKPHTFELLPTALSAQSTGVEGIAQQSMVIPGSEMGVPAPAPIPIAGAIVTVQPFGGGKELARGTTNAQGRFQIPLTVGDYTIVSLPSDQSGFYALPQKITVQPGRLTVTTLDYICCRH